MEIERCITCWHWDFANAVECAEPGEDTRPVAPCFKIPEMEWGSWIYSSGKECHTMSDFGCLLWDRASDEALAERADVIRLVNEKRADAEIPLIDVTAK